jgi:hypothetical protein
VCPRNILQKGKAPELLAPALFCVPFGRLGARLNDVDGIVDPVDGLVDVFKGTLLEALGEAVVFLVRDILMSFFEELFGAMEAAGVINSRVNRRMIVQVFSIIDGSLFDFSNGFIDLVNGVFFLFSQLATVMLLKVRASRTEVRQGVKVRRMLSLRGSSACAQEQQKSSKHCGHHEFGDGLHRHRFSLCD